MESPTQQLQLKNMNNTTADSQDNQWYNKTDSQPLSDYISSEQKTYFVLGIVGFYLVGCCLSYVFSRLVEPIVPITTNVHHGVHDCIIEIRNSSMAIRDLIRLYRADSSDDEQQVERIVRAMKRDYYGHQRSLPSYKEIIANELPPTPPSFKNLPPPPYL